MPNNITNKIEIKGNKEQVRQIFEVFSTHFNETPSTTYTGELIYSNKTTDEVGWLNEATGVFKRIGKEDSHTIPKGFIKKVNPAYDLFPDFNKVIPQPENIFKNALSSEKKKELNSKGIPNWYDWNTNNWGTKWNAYNCRKESENTFLFETAWCGVVKIIESIVGKFPNVEFIYKFADEDTGYNCGIGISRNGKLYMNYPKNNSMESYDLAFELNPDMKQYYHLSDGEYIPNED